MPAGSSARRLRWTLVVLGVAVVAVVGFTGWQALVVRDNLQSVQRELGTLGDQLRSGDRSGARRTVTSIQGHAARARASSSGPAWWLTSRLPGLGDDVDAVRTVTDVTDELATRVLPDVVEVTDTLTPQSLRPVGGRVQLAPLRAAAPTLARADARLGAEADRVAAVRTGALAEQIADPVRELQTRLADASRLSDRLTRAVRLLPPMLGADGPRSYLLIVQNNAEVRATGGIPGAFAVVRADGGRLSIGRQGAAGSVGHFSQPVLPLSRAEEALFGKNLARFPQDVTFTPDFPRAARLVQAMWRRSQGRRVDGVVSVDPVALAHLLRATGPVDVAAGRRLTADNAVRVLLSEVYADIPAPQQQDVFFASVAGQVFDAVSSGQGDPAGVLDQLVTSVGQRRVLVWSDRSDEQRLIAPTALSGRLPRDSVPATGRAARPHVGVYLNDASEGKLDYYLDPRVDVAAGQCHAGRRSLTVTVRLRSLVPGAATPLPSYVLSHRAGVRPRHVRTSVLLYGPVGGSLDRATASGRPVRLTPVSHGDRPVQVVSVDLAPSQTRRLTVAMTTGPGQTGAPDLQVTPGARGDGVGRVTAPAC